MAVSSADLLAAVEAARRPGVTRVRVGRRTVSVPRPFPSPEDWRDTWIYFLLVDRFNNPAAPPRQLPWDSEYDKFQGGTLAGVQAKLDYLQQLGVGALWLSPVLKNCQYDDTYHGYGIQDFLAVEPRLTSDPARARQDPSFADAELRALVDAAHARGIYVILDIVLNHAGDVFEYEGFGSQAPWRDGPPYPIRWRDENGLGRPDWPSCPPIHPRTPPSGLPSCAATSSYGAAATPSPGPGSCSSRQAISSRSRSSFTAPGPDGTTTVRDTLISAYQYAIAAFDVDGFRIDTLKFIEEDFALVFGNSNTMNEAGRGTAQRDQAAAAPDLSVTGWVARQAGPFAAHLWVEICFAIAAFWSRRLSPAGRLAVDGDQHVAGLEHRGGGRAGLTEATREGGSSVPLAQ